MLILKEMTIDDKSLDWYYWGKYYDSSRMTFIVLDTETNIKKSYTYDEILKLDNVYGRFVYDYYLVFKTISDIFWKFLDYIDIGVVSELPSMENKHNIGDDAFIILQNSSNLVIYFKEFSALDEFGLILDNSTSIRTLLYFFKKVTEHGVDFSRYSEIYLSTPEFDKRLHYKVTLKDGLNLFLSKAISLRRD